MTSGGINLIFILLTTYFLDLSEFARIVPYSIIIAIGMPIINNGSSEIYHKQNRSSKEYWLFSWCVWLVVVVLYTIALFGLLSVDKELIVNLHFAFALLTAEIFSRYFFDTFLRNNSVMQLEKWVLISSVLSLAISALLLLYCRSWVVLVIRPLITSVLRILFLAQRKHHLSVEESDVFGFFVEVRQIFVFNFVSSLVESLDRIFLLFGKIGSSHGTIERAGTFARLTDTTLRIPLFKVIFSKRDDSPSIMRFLLIVMVFSVVVFITVFRFLKPETPDFVLTAYCLFGIAWLLRGFYVNLELLQNGAVTNRVIAEMIGYGLFVVMIYSFSLSVFDLEYCVFIAGLIGIVFWGFKLSRLI